MKAVIWVVCVLIASAIQSQVRLGAIPMALLYGGMVFIANLLSRKWDDSHPKGK